MVLLGGSGGPSWYFSWVAEGSASTPMHVRLGLGILMASFVSSTGNSIHGTLLAFVAWAASCLRLVSWYLSAGRSSQELGAGVIVLGQVRVHPLQEFVGVSHMQHGQDAGSGLVSHDTHASAREGLHFERPAFAIGCMRTNVHGPFASRVLPDHDFRDCSLCVLERYDTGGHFLEDRCFALFEQSQSFFCGAMRWRQGCSFHALMEPPSRAAHELNKHAAGLEATHAGAVTVNPIGRVHALDDLSINRGRAAFMRKEKGTETAIHKHDRGEKYEPMKMSEFSWIDFPTVWSTMSAGT